MRSPVDSRQRFGHRVGEFADLVHKLLLQRLGLTEDGGDGLVADAGDAFNTVAGEFGSAFNRVERGGRCGVGDVDDGPD